MLDFFITVSATVFVVVLLQHLGWWPVHQIGTEEVPEAETPVLQIHFTDNSIREIKTKQIMNSDRLVHFLDFQGVSLTVPTEHIHHIERK